MRNRELKNKIKESFEKETPDILSKVKEDIENEQQISAPLIIPEEKEKKGIMDFLFSGAFMKRAASVALCLLMLVCGIFLGLFVPKNDAIEQPGNPPEEGNPPFQGGEITPPASDVATTRVFIDVNPSVLLAVNQEGRVTSFAAINLDAEKLLSGLSLEGVEVNTAVSAIVGRMYVEGYLSAESNSILLSCEDDEGDKSDELLQDITEGIEKMFEDSDVSLSVIAQSITVTENEEKKAEELGVSVGKIYLADKIIDKLDNLTYENEDELCKLSIGDLSFIYSDAFGDDLPSDDLISGSASGFLKIESIIQSVYEKLKIDSLLVESYSSWIDIELPEGDARLVYAVSVELKGELGSFKVKIDCKTGEILEKDLSLFDLK